MALRVPHGDGSLWPRSRGTPPRPQALGSVRVIVAPGRFRERTGGQTRRRDAPGKMATPRPDAGPFGTGPGVPSTDTGAASPTDDAAPFMSTLGPIAVVLAGLDREVLDVLGP